MLEDHALLDTPKKKSLQQQSTSLRAALKEYERTFHEKHGRKPKQAEIKNDVILAAKYKQYQRVQDVLNGKLAYEKLDERKEAKKPKSRTHSRQPSSVQSPARRSQRLNDTTPRRTNRHTDQVASETLTDDPAQQVLLDAIGPTPHRDGKLLGLFDLLQYSGSATTPSTSRKRKIEALYDETPAKRPPLQVLRSPNSRTEKQEQTVRGDILDFLSGTPVKTTSTSINGARKHSRTPQSEAKKFHLSQFFATPSTQRFLFPVEETSDDTNVKNTSQDGVIGQTPQKQPDTTGVDTTPVYLRRSTSFKDRLLSASTREGSTGLVRSKSFPKFAGPPTLRHFRSSTSNVLLLSDVPKQDKASKVTSHSQPANVMSRDDDHLSYDDELDVLREIESGFPRRTQSPDILVEDSQLHLDVDVPASPEPPDSDIDAGTRDTEVRKPYKKKGQKRTTKRSNIRPVGQAKKIAEPKYVAADGVLSDNEIVEETKLMFDNEFDDNDYDDFDIDESDVARLDDEGTARVYDGGMRLQEEKAKLNNKPQRKTKKQVGMINPNAQSHTNFRSLKIRSKNSKAKGAGRAKFGRGRK